MFLAGALVGTGSLSLGWALLSAIAGAIAGDGISFWIGKRYKARIVQLWPFRTHPQVLDAGHRFCQKHGAKSVVFARFIGPLRAIVPVVAGMLGMTPTRFYAMNVLSALLWAPAHILPGVVFGASMLLAGAVSFRLVVVIVLLVGIVWLSFRAMGFLLSHASAWSSAAGRYLGSWACRHPGPFGRLARRLLDPEQPDASSIVVTSLIVLASGALFFGVLEDVISGDPLVGSSFIDILELFEADPDTHAILLMGEIGGSAEEEAAEFVKHHVTKPVAAFIAGRTAPPGKRMGHAGAIISGGKGTAEAKLEALRDAGIEIAESPADMAAAMARAIEKRS